MMKKKQTNKYFKLLYVIVKLLYLKVIIFGFHSILTMRLLFFITFLTAILHSEVVTHVVTWENNISAECEIPCDETNESENSEENIEDNIEEDKLFEEFEFSTLVISIKVTELPCSCNTLLSQSLSEINLPPPDNA